ncbi:MAG: ParB/RepB/Spo0J family partition protein [Planctomycetota bacterium]
MQIQTLPLDQLHPHPQNSNVMPEAYLAKLTTHLQTTDRYPPVIVRPLREQEHAYQILDGHHRVKALQRLEKPAARCVVWDVDDDEALLLLATLNRLQGQDDPRKRAALVDQLHARMNLQRLAERLPEDASRLRKLIKINEGMPTPRAPKPLAEMPVAVHFFLLPAERRAVEQKLREVADTWTSREQALLKLLGIAETSHGASM